jgi:hypothetical protein
MMKQLARAKFSSYGLRVPEGWQMPGGNTGASHYGRAFRPEQRSTAPDPTVPPLFVPATMHAYHTDTQKRLTQRFGSFIDRTCDAICRAWGTWQAATTITGLQVNAAIAVGGKFVYAGVPWSQLIYTGGAIDTHAEQRYTKVIASVLDRAWQAYTTSIASPGIPMFPQFLAVPSPVVPPPGLPAIPIMLTMFTQVAAPVMAAQTHRQMVGELGDPGAQYHEELFGAICDAFEKCFLAWQTSTIINNVLGYGATTFAPPAVPAGQVVGGQASMLPGGIT